MKKKLHALLGVIAVACIVGGVAWYGVNQWQNHQANEATEAAEDQRQRELEEVLGTTTPPTTTSTTTTEPPTTTTHPPRTTSSTAAPSTSTTSTTSTTTTMPPTTTTVVPARDTLPVNAVFGALRVPAIGLDKTIARADETDYGHEALEGGAAWFPSSDFYDSGLGVNNLSMPGEGGNVAIGGHRGGSGRTGVFGRLHELNVDDEVVVETAWGLFTYKVTAPCHDDDQSHCTLSEAEILRYFVAYESSVETLFLFSCDTGMRIYVVAELVSAVPK